MSHSGLCRRGLCLIMSHGHYIAFGVRSLGLSRLGLCRFVILTFGVMSIGIMSFPIKSYQIMYGNVAWAYVFLYYSLIPYLDIVAQLRWKVTSVSAVGALTSSALVVFAGAPAGCQLVSPCSTPLGWLLLDYRRHV